MSPRPSTEHDRAFTTAVDQTLDTIRVRGYEDRFRIDPPALIVADGAYRLLLDPETMTARVETEEA
jgi:hypothetical protein